MQKKNKYVDFLDDDKFVELVKTVTDVYDNARGEEKIRKNGVDPFKTIFDMGKLGLNFKDWKKNELGRHNTKSVENSIGYFHQKLLGSVKGWKDMKVGKGLDICNDKKTIYIELKNKWNTTKGENKIDVYKKLEKFVKNNKNATAYYAYINAKKGNSGKARIWEVEKGTSNKRVKEIWGREVYKMVTGDKDALEKTWKAVNKVLKLPQKTTKKWFDESY